MRFHPKVGWAIKGAIGLIVAALPLYILVRSVVIGSARPDVAWLLLAVFVCLPSLIYCAGVRSRAGIAVVGLLLLVVTFRTWMSYGSDPEDSVNNFIPIVGVIPAIGVSLLGLVGDLAYSFYGGDSSPKGA